MNLKPGSAIIFLMYVFFMLIAACNKQQTFLSLHPQNPHYFLFRDKPTVLIGSTEHYGAVLNLDFDYIKYLDETASKGLNVTRTFTGIYLEPDGAFGIVNNTLAPAEGRLICPWTRSSETGYAFGGNKFDLTKWDEAYFIRLKDFISEAGKRNIAVELDLFSNFYDTLQWKLSPLYYSNNINNLPEIRDHKEILSLRHPEILSIQEKMVQKIVEELKGFENLYYEVCNEPYFGDLEALESWEQHMTNVIAEAEKDFPVKHLVSQNIANGSQLIENPNPFVSIFNFHYAKPPVVVEMNYDLNKVIGDNETGFNGTEDVNYRTEAWDFLVAGGGLYNNLDYSFATGHEDGSFDYPASQPGGGGSSLRAQLGILRDVFNEFDFINMKPLNKVLKTSFQGQTTCRVLAKEGEEYLLYLNNSHMENSNYSLRYSAYLSVPESGTYWFKTLSDDGIRLWVDDSLLINNWTNHGSVADSASINLSESKKHTLKIEYFQGLGGAVLDLSWRIPGGNMVNLPVSNITAIDFKTPGLNVEKFTGTDLKLKESEAIVTRVNQIGISPKDKTMEENLKFSIDLPEGNYSAEWIDTKTGQRTKLKIAGHKGGAFELQTPVFSEDVALKIVNNE